MTTTPLFDNTQASLFAVGRSLLSGYGPASCQDEWIFLLNQLHEAGRIDWSLPATEAGLPLLSAIADRHAVPAAWIEAVASLAGRDALLLPLPDGMLAIEHAFSKIGAAQNSAGHLYDDSLAAWALHAGGAFEAWLSCPQEGGTRGAHLLASLMKTGEWPKTLRALASRGALLTESLNGQPLASHINAKTHWEVFLEAGGSGELQGANPQFPDMPLWELLALRHPTQFLSIMKEMVPAADPALEKATYFHHLSRGLSQKVDKAREKLCSHPTWQELRDEGGRTPMMLAAANHPALFRNMLDKVSPTALGKKDAQGRSIWFYLFSAHDAQERTIKAGLIPGLASRVRGLPTADAKGRGLLVQLWMANRLGRGGQAASSVLGFALAKPPLNCPLHGPLPPSAWLTPEDLRDGSTFHKLLMGMSSSAPPSQLARLVQERVEWFLPAIANEQTGNGVRAGMFMLFLASSAMDNYGLQKGALSPYVDPSWWEKFPMALPPPEVWEGFIKTLSSIRKGSGSSSSASTSEAEWRRFEAFYEAYRLEKLLETPESSPQSPRRMRM